MTESSFALLTSMPALLVLALLAERLIPIAEQWHPLTWVRLFATYLGKKVNKAEHGAAQQRLAGLLALLLVLLLIVLPLVIIWLGAELPDAIGFLLLWMCLRNQHQRKQLRWVEQATAKGHKRAARALLGREVLRDTDSLSAQGLIKTCAELRVFGAVEKQFAVALGWLSGGPLLVLVVRLSSELRRVWPYEQRLTRQFSLANEILFRLLHAIPYTLVAMLLWLYALLRGRKPVRFKHIPHNGWFRPQAWLLFCVSRVSQLGLGGPLKYRGHRYWRQRFAGISAEQAASKLWQWSWLSDVLLLLLAASALFVELLLRSIQA